MCEFVGIMPSFQCKLQARTNYASLETRALCMISIDACKHANDQTITLIIKIGSFIS